jgi:hypothetical protein
MCLYFDDAYEDDTLRKQTFASQTNLNLTEETNKLAEQLGAQ